MEKNKLILILKLIFNIIKKSKVKNATNKKLLKDILSEDSTVIGFKYLTNTTTLFINNIDSIFDREKDTLLQEELSYIIYENNLFEKKISTEPVITYTKKNKEDKKYYLNTIEDCIKYYVEILIPEYLKSVCKNKKIKEKDAIYILKEKLKEEIINIKDNIDIEYKQMQEHLLKILDKEIEIERSHLVLYIEKELEKI